jgi:hypothetical protein
MSRIATEIGGYFGLEPTSGPPAELSSRDAAHLGDRITRLNSGRNCLRALLTVSNVRRIHLPDYICETLVQAVRSCGVEPVFYPVTTQLRPATEIRCADDELWLGVNYFGLLTGALADDARQTPHFVADNCQAFYAVPQDAAVSIYSPRKFFGVPDGGYLVGVATGPWPPDDSRDRLDHLCARDQHGAQAGYDPYREHESRFAGLPIRAMSALTETLLATTDHTAAAARRQENYRLLNAALGADNELTPAVDCPADAVPLVYPLLNAVSDLRATLQRHGIFTATYWAECLQRDTSGPAARHLADKLVALPIDQRYGTEHMHRIVSVVQQHLAASRIEVVVP